MSDMIERVARAICIASGHEPEIWEDEPDDIMMDFVDAVRNECRYLARAAIEAMREPSETMLAEVIKEPVHLYEGRDDDYVNLMKAATAADRLAARQRWQDLIDAALKGEAE